MSKNPEMKFVPEHLKNDKEIVKAAVRTGGPIDQSFETKLTSQSNFALIKLEDGNYAYINNDGKIIKTFDPSQQESIEPVEEVENENI